MKHILLAITGLNPQVVTETLYGLHKQDQPWPEELIILTTKTGAEQAKMGLLQSRNASGNTMLEQCCDDLMRPRFSDDAIRFKIITDRAGNAIEDARSREEQESLADCIVKQVAQLCANPDMAIHASLAGGRKTMTFYLGYAMSLFARPQDKLSHVLIAPAQYEGLRQFYYPTPYSQPIPGRGDNQLIDTHEENVQVTLADIPFIRQREQLSQDVLGRFSNPDEILTYRELVQLQDIASSSCPYRDIRLNFEIPEKRVDILHQDRKIQTLDMSDAPLELAFFAMIARHNSIHSAQRYSREQAQKDDIWYQYRDLYLSEYWQLLHPGEMQPALEQWYAQAELAPGEQKTLEGLKYASTTFFDDRKKNLKKKLESALPKIFVTLLEPSPVFRGNDGKIRLGSADEQQLERNIFQLKEEQRRLKKQCQLASNRELAAELRSCEGELATIQAKCKLLGLRVSSNLCQPD